MHQKTVRKIFPSMLTCLLALFVSLLAGCGGGGSDGGCGFMTCASTTTGTGTTTGTSSATVTVAIGNGVTTLPTTGAVTVSATVKDATGAAVSDAVVTFSADSTYATLNPTTGTARTNSSGVAMIQMSAASLTPGGASTVTASASVGGVAVTGSATYVVSAANIAMAVGIFDGSGNSTSTLSSSGSVTVRATVVNSSGMPVSGTTVKFETLSSLAVFNPSTGTAQTNSSGVATVQMSSAGLTVGGAGEVTASLTDSGMPKVSSAASYQVGAANVTLGTLSICTASSPTCAATANIPAYGTGTVAVTVNVNGVPTTSPITVNFSSGCATSGKASIASSVLTINGVATATYTDKGCNGTDTITATVLDKAVQGTIKSAGPAPANIQFVSATPSQIALKGTAGLIDISNVTFKVVDSSGNPVAATQVEFYLTNWTGGIKLDDNTQTQVDALTGGKVRKQTAADGTVVVTVQAGTNPTSIWVLANVVGSTLSTQSSKLVISTGLPSQDRFSLSAGTHNIEGWDYDGVTTSLTVYAFDRVGNPIPDGSTINFVTEGAGTSPTSGACSASNGTCSIQFVSGERRPRLEGVKVCLGSAGNYVTDSDSTAIASTCVSSGRVTVLAYANGEEGFDDSNGNNLYDAGEAFRDIGDIYIDSNENGSWDSFVPEQYFPFVPVSGSQGTSSCRTDYLGYGTAKSKANTCNGKWGQAQVRRDQVIILSGSYVGNFYSASSNVLVKTNLSGVPYLQLTDSFISGVLGVTAIGGAYYVDANNDGVADLFDTSVPKDGILDPGSEKTMSVTSCTASMAVRIADGNNNPLPAGSALAIAHNNVLYVQNGTPDPATAVVTLNELKVLDTTIPGGTTHSIGLAGTKCLSVPAGAFDLVVTSPKGLVSTISVKVN